MPTVRGCGFSFFFDLIHRSVEPIHRLLIPAWDEMPVKVHRDLNRRMTHLFLDVDRAFALLKQKTGERMAKVMKANFTQASSLESPIKDTVSEVVRM